MGQHMDVVTKNIGSQPTRRKRKQIFRNEKLEIICNLGVGAVAKVIED